MAEEYKDKTDGDSDKESDESSSVKDAELLQLCRDRYKLAEDFETEVRQLADEDHRFAAGEQWPADVKRQREQDNRICLTINRIPQFVRQITNDIRQNRPAIRVSPVDDNADVETAKVLQGLIRHIEYASSADIAYDTAVENAVRGGFGFFRIVTDYSDPYSFEQDIKIQAIKNPFSVYLDPTHQSPDGSDCNWAIVFADLSYDEYKSQFPDSEIKSATDWGPNTDGAGWLTKETVRVAEYFYKEFEEKTLVKLSNGDVVLKDQMPKDLPVGQDGQQISIAAERKTLMPKICWVKTNGVEILDKKDWAGQWIPIVPVLGQELLVNGKRVLESLVRHAKDSQRMLNYWKSCETEAIALAPKSPWIIAGGQLEGYEHFWNEANTKTHPYLPYNPTINGGQAVPPPIRNSFEPAVQAITNAAMYAADDLKATTGIYDAALGARSNENSGVAIQRRNIQAQTSNFHFVDNLSKSIRHAGRILVDLIPHIYDTERAVRILGEDGKEEIVTVNAVFDPNQPDAKKNPYNLNKGKYDVTVSTGPSYETKRQEAVASMLDFTKSMPQQASLISDILVKNMDFPQAEEIAERLRKTLPPNIVGDKDQEQQQIPPQVQAQMQQMSQVIEQLTQEVKAHSEIAEQKRMELESKERIEFAKIQAQLQMKLMDTDSKESMALLGHEMASIKHRLDLLNIDQPIENENQETNEAQGAGAQAPNAMASQQQPLTGEQNSPASTGGYP